MFKRVICFAVLEPATSPEVSADDLMLRGALSFSRVFQAELLASVSWDNAFSLLREERDQDRTRWLSKTKGLR